jgi:hypothetical protein
MKVKDLVKKLLELDQGKEVKLSPKLIDALDINPIVNNRKFPTQRNKVVFTYKSKDLLPLSLYLYWFDTRLNMEYFYKLNRSMTNFPSSKLDWMNFRTSIGRWSFRSKGNIKSTRP